MVQVTYNFFYLMLYRIHFAMIYKIYIWPLHKSIFFMFVYI